MRGYKILRRKLVGKILLARETFSYDSRNKMERLNCSRFKLLVPERHSQSKIAIIVRISGSFGEFLRQ